MTRNYFGTDGIRGKANSEHMSAEFALRLGIATGRYFRRDKGVHRVVIGKDTRRSGYMLEQALTAGFTSVGMDVFLLGPVPTPAVGLLTRSMRADLGVMISASHNPYYDNGIKFFGPDGFKLSDEAELEIEAMLDTGGQRLAAPENIGRASRINEAGGRYMEFVKTTIPRALSLAGLKIVVDCAHGAAYKVAPQVLWELGAEVIALGVDPDGYNINEGCGSTHTDYAAARVLEEGADLGICLDGDADRVMVIDEKGQVADGDQIMALIAQSWATEGRLAGGTLVATVMSNLGLERHMETLGLNLLRTNVGDRYVVEAMRKGCYNLGGEQSGHIVMSDHVSTGDGLISALQVLSAMAKTGKRASDLVAVFVPVPQLLQNVRYDKNTDPLAAKNVQVAIADGEARLAANGRLLIRKSGTEPLLRVMGECEDEGLLRQVVNDICAAIEGAV